MTVEVHGELCLESKEPNEDPVGNSKSLVILLEKLKTEGKISKYLIEDLQLKYTPYIQAFSISRAYQAHEMIAINLNLRRIQDKKRI